MFQESRIRNIYPGDSFPQTDTCEIDLKFETSPEGQTSFCSYSPIASFCFPRKTEVYRGDNL